jgi:hypothetical protein
MNLCVFALYGQLIKNNFVAEIYFTFFLSKLHPMENADNYPKVGGGQTQWTSSQSSYMLTFLANLVADGTKTSTGFKKAQLNACANALNEHFKIHRTGEQIGKSLEDLEKEIC